jgi:selenocysteine lyase/cysteine desulfurase
MNGAGIVTMTHQDIDPALIAERLDREFDVQARAGLHCAPEVHRLLGTEATGALRFSLGWCSTADDVDRALEGVEAIARRPATRVS